MLCSFRNTAYAEPGGKGGNKGTGGCGVKNRCRITDTNVALGVSLRSPMGCQNPGGREDSAGRVESAI